MPRRAVELRGISCVGRVGKSSEWSRQLFSRGIALYNGVDGRAG